MTYNSHEEAQNALETLHETHTFPGMDVAMVLKWVDQDLQKRRKMGPDAMGGPMYGESAGLVTVKYLSIFEVLLLSHVCSIVRKLVQPVCSVS